MEYTCVRDVFFYVIVNLNTKLLNIISYSLFTFVASCHSSHLFSSYNVLLFVITKVDFIPFSFHCFYFLKCLTKLLHRFVRLYQFGFSRWVWVWVWLYDVFGGKAPWIERERSVALIKIPNGKAIIRIFFIIFSQALHF